MSTNAKDLVPAVKAEKVSSTLRIAGAMELGRLDEKKATLGETAFPTTVLEGLNFTRGNLSKI